VIIVDDMVDTGSTIQALSHNLHDAGANQIIVCASHGLFTENAMENIDSSKITNIIVTDSLPLPKNASSKILQISLAPFLGDMILTEHFRSVALMEDTFANEEEEE
jgi:ribose-phosphate pyrophosphokinase